MDDVELKQLAITYKELLAKKGLTFEEAENLIYDENEFDTYKKLKIEVERIKGAFYKKGIKEIYNRDLLLVERMLEYSYVIKSYENEIKKIIIKLDYELEIEIQLYTGLESFLNLDNEIRKGLI